MFCFGLRVRLAYSVLLGRGVAKFQEEVRLLRKTQIPRRTGPAVLVGLLFTIYTLTNSGGFHIIDEVSLFAVTESLAQRGAVDTNAIAWTQWVNSPGEVLGAFGPGGEVYSKKGPGPAFVSAVWYQLIRLGAGAGLPWGLLQGTLLWNGLVTALTAALLWRTAVRLGYCDRTGLGLGLLFGLGTIAWPYANHLFGEPLSAFALLLCFFGLLPPAGDRRPTGADPTDRPRHTPGSPLLAGIGAALAIATVTAHGLLVAVFGGYFLWHVWKQQQTPADRRPTTERITHYASLITPLLLALLLLGLYNTARFGSPLDTGYHFDRGEGFTTPLGQGLWGLLLSPYRGVFWHTPLLLLSAAAFPAFLRRHRAEGLLIAGLSATLIGLYSLWWMWWGGFAWGPRFLVPLTPLWVLLLAPLLARLTARHRASTDPAPPARRLTHYAVLIPSLLSFLVQLSAVVVNYVNYEIELRGIFPTDWEDPLAFGPPAQALSDFLYSPVFGQWRLMADNFIANTDLAWLWADGTVQWPVLAVGGLALLAQAGALMHWLSATGSAQSSPPVSRHRSLLTFSVPLLFTLLFTTVWLSSVGANPRYGTPGEGYRAALAEIGTAAGEGDGIVTVTPFHYQIPMNWLGGVYDGGLPLYGYATDSAEKPETVQVLSRALATHPQLWYVSAGLPPAAPENSVERWLAENAFKAEDGWFGDFRLLRYATPGGLADAPARQLDATLADRRNRVDVRSARLPQTLTPGQALPLALEFQVAQAQDPLRWFVQLLGPDGAPVALLDTAPLDGYTTFPELPAGEILTERAGLALPSGLAAGEYRLIAGLYNPSAAGSPRLTRPDGADFVELAVLHVPIP